jgi:acetyl-CoA C-acetyltransferase
MRDVAVIGVGMSKWGEVWKQSLRQLFVDAASAAIENAGVDKIDSMYVGCMSGGLFVGQEHLASLLSDYLGVSSIPACRVESACASGGLAFRQGFVEVASGMSDVVLVGGVEKMTDVDGGQATYALATAADQEYEVYQGITFPALYAMIANAHMKRFGTTLEQLAHVTVKNQKHGSMNPRAQYPFEVTVEGVLCSTLVADPLRILHCSPITDGAAAVVLCPLDAAKKLSKNRPVKVTGTGQSTDTIALHDREDITELAATRRAAEKAFKMAGVGPSDIDIAEICAIEALGFVDRGKGGEAAESGLTALGGRIPVNTSGGLKSKGHPVGATGVAQVVEVTEQLRGESGSRQVQGAKRGLTQNMGGSGGSAVVHILEVA